MTTESVMFALLRKEICGEILAPEVIEQLSPQMLEELYTLSHRHDLSHLVGHALSELGVLQQDETSQKFQNSFVSAVSRYVRMSHELYSVCSALEEEQIPHMPLKGSLIRNWYPEPWMRTCTDIDVLVKKQDLERTVAIFLEKLGYQHHKTGICNISMFSPTGVHFELHVRLVIDELQNQILDRVWDAAELEEGYAYRYKMPEEWFRFYHIVHMAKHIASGGCGIRPFLDLWIMDRNAMQDCQDRTALLAEGKLVVFAKVAKALSEHWFSNAPADDKAQMLASYVLSGGKHGILKNKLTVWKIRRGGHLRYTFYRVFKPYSLMKEMYPILEKHKWLVPACLVHRCFSLVLQKEKRQLFAQESNVSITQEDKDTVAQLLKALEL